MRQILLIFSFVLIGCHNNDDRSLKQLHKPSLSKDLTGRQLYMKHCAICHKKDANGIIGVFHRLRILIIFSKILNEPYTIFFLDNRKQLLLMAKRTKQ